MSIFTGCRHARTTLPFAANKPSYETHHTDWQPATKISTTHYVVCLDCGRRFAYDWSKMRIVRGA
ncbi:MAG TPA: hypothetical protein VEG32_10095 [Clostridia bacterium]|nr:hypothetical protein [Clostridia bacterium]